MAITLHLLKALPLSSLQGKHDRGIVTLKATKSRVLSSETLFTDPTTHSKVLCLQIELDRGISWDDAIGFKQELMEQLRVRGIAPSAVNGFYKKRYPRQSVTSAYVCGLMYGRVREVGHGVNHHCLPLGMTHVVVSSAWHNWHVQ